jgi:hypothetical protein
MFNETKYSKIYFDIINKAKTRSASPPVERHHIIPKSMGGSNKKENIVELTPREHFICHWLLTKMVVDSIAKRSMNYAFWRMVVQTSNKKQNRNYRITSRAFESARSGLTGKPHSTESKEKISKSKIGSIRSEESRSKQSKTTKGVPKSSKHRSAISEASKKRWQYNRPTPINCEHCGKSAIPGNYKRWHGENCRFKMT